MLYSLNLIGFQSFLIEIYFYRLKSYRYIFENNSKFGTLVREENMGFEIKNKLRERPYRSKGPSSSSNSSNVSWSLPKQSIF